MSGTGWTCSFPNCTRADVLLSGQSYPSISVVVNVAANAAASVTSQVTVIGGASLPGTASDPTTILPPAPLFVITQSHAGNFAQGQIGAQYTISVRNAGVGATAGLVSMAETPPAGLTVTAMSGTGWTCNTTTCTRSDALPPGATLSACHGDRQRFRFCSIPTGEQGYRYGWRFSVGRRRRFNRHYLNIGEPGGEPESGELRNQRLLDH
jgi:hypothetical protein